MVSKGPKKNRPVLWPMIVMMTIVRSCLDFPPWQQQPLPLLPLLRSSDYWTRHHHQKQQNQQHRSMLRLCICQSWIITSRHNILHHQHYHHLLAKKTPRTRTTQRTRNHHPRKPWSIISTCRGSSKWQTLQWWMTIFNHCRHFVLTVRNGTLWFFETPKMVAVGFRGKLLFFVSYTFASLHFSYHLLIGIFF